jgi:outer membrane lipoprotein-sorting protein
MRRGTIVRWGVPIAAAAVIGAAVGAGPVIAAVSGAPALPERTARQLLADAAAAARADGPLPLSGTLQQTASLGLPALPGQEGMNASPLSLLSGSHEAKIWYGDKGRMRIALPGQMSETNLIVNGDQSWFWESGTNTATKIRPSGETDHGRAEAPAPTMTPQQAAAQMLDKVDADTAVSVTNTAEVAGRAAYQLVLTPKPSASLVREVRVAIDGEKLVPLQVQVFAKGSAEPAFQVGFTEVTFTPPAEENFTFTPPAGAKVKEQDFSDLKKSLGEKEGEQAAHAAAKKSEVVGKGWTSVLVMPFKLEQGGQGKGQNQAVTDAVLASATPVSGTWGSGKLLKTKLVSALLTDDGRLLAGAVAPDELLKAAESR